MQTKIDKKIKITIPNKYSIELDTSEDTVKLECFTYDYDQETEAWKNISHTSVAEFHKMLELMIELTKHMMIDTDTEYGEIPFDDIFGKENQIDMSSSEVL